MPSLDHHRLMMDRASSLGSTVAVSNKGMHVGSWHSRDPSVAPTESLLTEAMLKRVCVLPNLAYLESPQGIPRTARKIVAGHNRAIVDRIKEVAGKATRAMNFPQSSVALGRALRLIEPALAARGVIMEWERVTAGTRIRFRMTG